MVLKKRTEKEEKKKKNKNKNKRTRSRWGGGEWANIVLNERGRERRQASLERR